MVDLIDNGYMKYSNDCWDFYKPSYKMKNGEWIVASTFADSVRYNTKIPYTYRKLLADIESVVENMDELNKTFIPMRQRQYFKKQGNYYDALISRSLIVKVLSLYNLKEKKMVSIIRRTKLFDLNDYLQKYEEYARCKSPNEASDKVPKLEIQPYRGTITTREDIMMERVESIRGKATEAEESMCKILSALNINYVFQYACNIGNDIIMDFYIPSKRISIEIDGGYHNDINQLMRPAMCASWHTCITIQ